MKANDFYCHFPIVVVSAVVVLGFGFVFVLYCFLFVFCFITKVEEIIEERACPQKRKN